ncbi:MAG: hypothetical protein JWO57_448 [Pseudonocardiales bacterium]|nr:hypothetical protein [Pseudonocardiales bacterium]
MQDVQDGKSERRALRTLMAARERCRLLESRAQLARARADAARADYEHLAAAREAARMGA